jgi:uncharacterized membrane protein affecting hemolysin expression
LNSPIDLILKPLSSQELMREQVAHVAWLITHLIRSAWDEHRDRSLASSLASEVRLLQAELHHTQQILSGYSSVVSTCERRNSWQARVNETFIILFIFLLLALGWFWVQKRLTKRPTVLTITGDTGGPSDSDSGPEVKKVSRPTSATGPTRPSQLGKGRR